MKKTLLYLAVVLLAAGCAQDIELTEPLAAEGDPQTEYQPLTRSLDGAVYNEIVDAWMVPQADPYSLANFQAAYDKLAAGKSTQKLSKAQAAEFSTAKKLAPTHYALKIYPKTEEEQWRVETMEDVQVAYIPFDWVQLSRDEVETLPSSKTLTRSAANTFAEKSPYTVTYDYTDVTDGGPTGPVTYQLPILYTVWPVSKPLPTDLEYVVDYEIFIPYEKSGTPMSEASRVLRNEVRSTMLRIPTGGIIIPPYEINPPSVSGEVLTYDNSLGRNVPMAGLDTRYTEGSFIVDTYTDGGGRFGVTMPTGYNPISITPTIVFTYKGHRSAWKITPSNSTNPYGDYRTINLTRLPNDYVFRTTIILETDDAQLPAIHRAVNYFYGVQSDFPRHSPTGGLRIIANSSSGRPFYSGSNHTVNIFRRELDSSNGFIIGDTLHEIGHLFHHLNNQSHYNNTNIFLYESFACYVGWYLGEAYYRSVGWTGTADITRYAQQAWTKTDPKGASGGEYSPLFVDLTDNNNQWRNNPNRPNDNIQGVPPSVIWDIITYSRTWAQCRMELERYIGIRTGKYYTQEQFDEWIESYDDWVEDYY